MQEMISLFGVGGVHGVAAATTAVTAIDGPNFGACGSTSSSYQEAGDLIVYIVPHDPGFTINVC